MAGVSPTYLDRLVGAFPDPPLAVVLFGSVARGQAATDSDTDLLVVFDGDVRVDRALYRHVDAIVEAAASPNPPSVQLVSLPPRAEDVGGLWLEAALDGRVLWERGTQVSAFLRRLRDRIASGTMRRRTAHGHPYWVRKEEGE